MTATFTSTEIAYIASAAAEYVAGTYGDLADWTAAQVATHELEGDARDQFGDRADAVAAEIGRRVVAAAVAEMA